MGLIVAVASTLMTLSVGERTEKAAATTPVPSGCYSCSGGLENAGSYGYHSYWELGGDCSGGDYCIDCTGDPVCDNGGGDAYYADPSDAYSWLMREGCDGARHCAATSPSPDELIRALLEADDETAKGVVLTMIEASGGAIQYNAHRHAIQITGCAGGIVSQFEVSASLGVALAASLR
jgi:hypothetical protein